MDQINLCLFLKSKNDLTKLVFLISAVLSFSLVSFSIKLLQKIENYLSSIFNYRMSDKISVILLLFSMYIFIYVCMYDLSIIYKSVNLSNYLSLSYRVCKLKELRLQVKSPGFVFQFLYLVAVTLDGLFNSFVNQVVYLCKKKTQNNTVDIE